MSEREPIWAAWNEAVGFAAESIRGGSHAHATAQWIAANPTPELWQIVEVKLEIIGPVTLVAALAQGERKP